MGKAGAHAGFLGAALLSILPAVAMAEERPRTCLVLGGGGARGAAHVGILKVLERERVPIDCVVGTSMGAIVGGLYSIGYTSADVESALAGVDWYDVFHDDPPRGERSMRSKDDDYRFLGGVEVGLKDGHIMLPQGLMQGQKLFQILRRLTLPAWNIEEFDDFPLPFRAIATDIGTGQKVVFSEGDLALAIRASMSVPGAFAPVHLGDRLLVDGGIVDNLPIDEGRKLGAERLIVVRVGSRPKDLDKLNSPLAIANQMIGELMLARTQMQIDSLQPQDLLLSPELGDFSAADFADYESAMKIGLATAEANLEAIRRFSVSEEEYARFAARHQQIPFDAPLVAFLDVNREHTLTGAYVRDRMRSVVGKPLDVDEVEQKVALTYGDGRYQQVRWDLEQRGEDTGIVVAARDKGWGPTFLHFGARISDDFNGRSAYQLTGELKLTGLNAHAGEARARLAIGELMNVHAEFFQPWGQHGRWYALPYLDYSAANTVQRIEDDRYFAELRREQTSAGLELGWLPDNRIATYVALERARGEIEIVIGAPDLVAPPAEDAGSVRAGVKYDTLDTVSFPTRGLRIDVSHEVYDQALGSDSNAWASRIALDYAFSFGVNRLLLGVKAGIADDSAAILSSYSVLGGLTNFSGYADNEIVATDVALARAVYYRRLNRKGQQFDYPLYAGASVEYGGFWATRDAMSLDDMDPAGSVFVGLRTPLGPVFFGYGRTVDDIQSWYLRFGPLLQQSFRF